MDHRCFFDWSGRTLFRLPNRRIVISGVAVAQVFLALLLAAQAQEVRSGEVGVRQQITSTGIRRFEDGAWGVVGVEMTNDRDEPALVETGLYFEGDPLTQFSRQAWVPARARRRTWVPARPPENGPDALDIRPFLHVRDDSNPPPDGSSESLLAAESLFPTNPPVTVIVEDREAVIGDASDSQKEFVIAMRLTAGLTRTLTRIGADEVPSFQHGLDAADYLVLTGNQVADSPSSLSTIRTWLERGGRLWIMLDTVDMRTVDLLLGDAVRITEVDRVRLSEFQIQNLVKDEPAGPRQQHDDPLEFVRVLAEGARVTHEVDGWPASFSREIGLGRVTFTTLGADAWMRPREPHEQVEDVERNSLFIARQCLDELALYVNLPLAPPPLAPADFEPLLSDEIGYRIPGRSTVALVLGLFWGVLLIVGVWSFRAARTERVALFAPPLAGLASIPLAVLGYQASHAIPPAAALAEVVYADSGSTATHSAGGAAVFVPEPTSASIHSGEGRLLLPQRDRFEGTIRKMVWTGPDEWHWAELTLPTGLSFASTGQHTLVSAPLRATATVGTDGLSGQLESGRYTDLSDALIATSTQHALAVHLEEGGRFSAGQSDLREPGIYLTAPLLTEEQRRRHSIYQRMLLPRVESKYPDRPMLLAWARPDDVGVSFPDEMRVSRTALLVVPLEIQAPPPGTELFIPSPLLPFESVATAEGTSTLAHDPRTGQWQKTSYPTATTLRFSVPRALLPLRPVRATLFLRLRAPMRTVELASGAADNLVPLATLEAPLGDCEVPIDEPDALVLDDDGGLHVQLTVSNLKLEETGDVSLEEIDRSWKMDFIRLEMHGRSSGSPEGPGAE